MQLFTQLSSKFKCCQLVHVEFEEANVKSVHGLDWITSWNQISRAPCIRKLDRHHCTVCTVRKVQQPAVQSYQPG